MFRHTLRLDRLPLLVTGVALLLYFPSSYWELSSKPGSGMTQGLAPYLAILLAVVWAAPMLAREFETGTSVWAWTQGTTRSRWFFSRAALPILAAVVSGLALTGAVMVSGMHRPVFVAHDHMSEAYLSTHGPYLVLSSLCAIATGLAAAAATRRAVPAIGISLIAQIAMTLLMPKLATSIAPTTTATFGRTVSDYQIAVLDGHQTSVTRLADGGTAVEYQANSHFWEAQLVTGAVFLALTALLLAYAWRTVRTLPGKA
ncbi:hypothetical protein AB0D10_22695 [Kitasatospora sp. NPDC048545]|uniref:hypothetical protein n=1 Tax=unclassified Kitasatospora TaxID=2633591 RepID=UPI00341096F2